MKKNGIKAEWRTVLTAAAAVLLLVSLVAGSCALVELIDRNNAYTEGDKSYEAIKAAAVRESGGIDEPDARQAGKPRDGLDVSVDFGALERISEDASAWLFCPGTVIDYPVMKADDYSYYLHHLPDGSYNVNGALFIDYNCASDFSGPLTVIYGHHMKSGKMFGTLVGYKKQDYYEAHPEMYLYTKNKNYRIELLYGCVIGAGEWRAKGYMYQQNLNNLLSYAKTHTTFKSAAKAAEDNRYVVLLTCTYEFDDARYIVIGLLEPLP